MLARLFVFGMDSSGVFGFFTTAERPERLLNRKFKRYGHSQFFHVGHYQAFWLPLLKSDQIIVSPDTGCYPPWYIKLVDLIPSYLVYLLKFIPLSLIALLLYVIIPIPGDKAACWLNDGEINALTEVAQAAESNNHAEAERNLQHAYRLCRHNSSTIRQLGAFYHKRNQYQQAAKFYHEAFELSGRSDVELAKKIGASYLGEKDYQNALKWTLEAERLNKIHSNNLMDMTSLWLMFQRGEIYLALLMQAKEKDLQKAYFSEAIHAMENFLRENKIDAPTWAHYSIGCAHAVMGIQADIGDTEKRFRVEQAVAELQLAVASLEKQKQYLPDFDSRTEQQAIFLRERIINKSLLGGQPKLPDPCPAIAEILSRGAAIANLTKRLSAIEGS